MHLIRTSRREGKGALWQGGADDVIRHGASYDVIILCADEWQPKANLIAPSSVQVVHAPNDDSGGPLTRQQAAIAIAASRVAAQAYRKEQKVLISCMQGRNRSGLVTALTLHRLYGMAGERCIGYIRARVPHALSNDAFQTFLRSIQAKVQNP